MNGRDYARLAWNIYRTDGPISLLEYSVLFAYNRVIRSRLPEIDATTVARYHDVSVAIPARRFDRFIPFAGSRPGYERALIRAIREVVTPGARVVHVGGGYGIAAVESARAGGTDTDVIVFEGAAEWAKKVEETATLNRVDDRVDARHGIVTDHAHLKGIAGDAKRIPPSELPPCDVLVLDCEGAESEILEDLSVRPEYIVVETHGWIGTPTDTIDDRLRGLSYDVVARLPAHAIPKRRDQYVLVGKNAATGSDSAASIAETGRRFDVTRD